MPEAHHSLHEPAPVVDSAAVYPPGISAPLLLRTPLPSLRPPLSEYARTGLANEPALGIYRGPSAIREAAILARVHAIDELRAQRDAVPGWVVAYALRSVYESTVGDAQAARRFLVYAVSRANGATADEAFAAMDALRLADEVQS